MTEHKHAEVLRAIADGKEVEYLYINQWLPMTADRSPLAQPEREWRVKPEPKPPIVVDKHIYWGEGCTCHHLREPNIRFTFDPDTKLPIKVELI